MPVTIYQRWCIIVDVFFIIQCVATLTAISLKAKKTSDLYSLIAVNVAVILWMFASVVGSTSIDTEMLTTITRFGLVPIMFLGPLWLIFVIDYKGISFGRKPWIKWLLLLPTISCFWPVLSPKYFYLLIEHRTLERQLYTEWGSLFIIHTAVSYIYHLISVALILRKPMNKNKLTVWEITIAAMVLTPIIYNLLAFKGVIRPLWIDPGSICFSVILAVLAVLVFRHRMLELIPTVAYELFMHINEAVILIDKKGRIQEWNAACRHYFDNVIEIKTDMQAKKFLSQIYSRSSDESAINADSVLAGNEAEDVIKFRDKLGREKEYYISVAPIKISENKKIGMILSFKDITEYGLITLLNERNRLSADLHDSLGNSLNAIGSNLEYAVKQFYQNPTQAYECIKTSYARTTGAFLDLRRIVDELKPIDIENNGLIWALESLFRKVSNRINVEFAHTNIDDKQISCRQHGEAIYLICQEALNNAVTHGKAQNISITLTQSNDLIKLYITDDGIGCEMIVKNKGLTGMENRVKKLRGEITYGSPSGGGFNIKAVFPFNPVIEGERSAYDQSIDC